MKILREFISLLIKENPASLGRPGKETMSADSTGFEKNHLRKKRFSNPKKEEQEEEIAPHLLNMTDEETDENYGPVPPGKWVTRITPDSNLGTYDNVTWQR